MKRFSNKEKVDGEMAIREMPFDVQKWYGQQDYVTVYATTVYLDEDDLVEYGVDVNDGKITEYTVKTADGYIAYYQDIRELAQELEAWAEDEQEQEI